MQAARRNELILMSIHYPFHYADSYMDDEVAMLSHYFDKIRIFSLNRDQSKARPIPANAEAERIDFQFNKIHYLKALGLFFKPLFWGELFDIVFVYRHKKIFGALKSAFKYYARSLAYKEFFDRKLSNDHENLVYSYFMLECSLAALLLRKKKNIRIISRLHRYDLYFEAGEYGYLPFRRFFTRELDAMYFISEDGKSYYVDKLRLRGTELMNKLHVSRLGFFSKADENLKHRSGGVFRMVSTSWITENKRQVLFAEALKLLPLQTEIEWVHFGDYIGIDKNYYDLFLSTVEEIKSRHPNIHLKLMGATSKEYILDYYDKHEVHLFTNVSASEGVPVSMMEACRYGIPILGTDVGGVAEILKDGYNGILLPSDPNAAEIADVLNRFIKMPEEEYHNMKKNALQMWKDHYNPVVNYQKFVQSVARLWQLKEPKENMSHEYGTAIS